MKSNLFSTTVYLDKALLTKVDHLALVSGKLKDVIIRDVMAEGLKVYAVNPAKSGKALLDLAEFAETLHIHGPDDLSTRHDYYTWDA